MSLRQYEYALAVAEEGSVTAAAERLHVAQPSISQQIRTLERELGVSLFARTPRGLVQTVAGRAFLREAEVAVRAARRARALARSSVEHPVGELVVATYMGLGSRRLPRAVHALRRRYPGLEVTLLEEPGLAELERRGRDGSLDVALITHLPPECDFRAHRLGDEIYRVVLGPGHRLLDQDLVALRDLAAEPWIRFPCCSALDQVVDRALQEADLQPPVVARAAQVGTAARLAVENLGITVLPGSAIPHGYEHLSRPLDPSISHPVLAAVREGAGPAEAALVAHLSRPGWHDQGLDVPRSVTDLSAANSALAAL